MEQQGINALVPEKKEETPQIQNIPQIPGPVFEPGPGWGAKLSRWLGKNLFRKMLPVIAIIAIVIGIILFLNRGRKETSLIIPEVTPKATEEVKITPGGVFLVKAQKGDGITHLARKALKEYLNNNPSASSGLTAEHKIYIEDYLKDQKGERFLEIGEELEFSESDILAAIEEAKGLSESQLTNLSQYVPLVSGL